MTTNADRRRTAESAATERITERDVSDFIAALDTWTRSRPPRQQALVQLVLATAAAADEPDVSAYLAGLAVPNPEDVVVFATGAASGTQADEVVEPSANAVAGGIAPERTAGAAGGALARALLNRRGES